MFAKSLDNASKIAKSDYKQITPKKSREHDVRIVHDMAEYMFDVFDANLMPEFHLMEAFEEKAIPKFFDRESNDDEYTFEQQQAHTEFLNLFESLLGNFLVQKNLTIDQLLDEVKWFVKEGNCEAQEILEVVDSFSNFKRWADHMTEQARNFKLGEAYIKQLTEAAHIAIKYGDTTTNSRAAESKTRDEVEAVDLKTAK
jgi:hypothetical protein